MINCRLFYAPIHGYEQIICACIIQNSIVITAANYRNEANSIWNLQTLSKYNATKSNSNYPRIQSRNLFFDWVFPLLRVCVCVCASQQYLLVHCANFNCLDWCSFCRFTVFHFSAYSLRFSFLYHILSLALCLLNCQLLNM